MNTVWHLILITAKLSTSQVEYIDVSQYLTLSDCQKEGHELVNKVIAEARDTEFTARYLCEAE